MRRRVAEAEERARWGEYAEAIALLREERDPAGLLLLGDCLERAGRARDAEEVWRRLPASAPARLRIARARIRAGSYEAAIEHAQAGLESVRNSLEQASSRGRLMHDLLLEWSEAAYRLRCRTQAGRLLNEAARAWPQSPRPLVVLALRAEDGDAARRLFTAALVRVPSSEKKTFFIQVCAESLETPHGAAILEILADHGLAPSAHDGALRAWRARYRSLG